MRNKNQPRSSIISRVDKTLIRDCSLNAGSLLQIAQFLNNARARKSISFGSEINFNELSRNFSYSEDLKNSIDSSTSFCLISNSCSESPDLIKHSVLCLFSYNFKNSGAINLTLTNENKYEFAESGFMSEKNILLSNTSIIFVYLY